MDDSEPLRCRLERLAGTGSYEWDVRSGSVTWSPQLYRLLDRDPAAGPLTVADLASLVRPADVAAGARTAAWLVEHGRTIDVTCPVTVRGGIRHLRAVAEPVFDVSGRLTKVRGVVKDSTATGPAPASRFQPAGDGVDEPAADRMASRLRALVVPADPTPVTLGGLHVQARRLPATGTGGAWFHTARLATGRALLACGDVAGKGLQAAATMANLRARLIGSAARTDEPDRLAALLNEALTEAGDGVTASAVIAIWDPVPAELAWVRAGHPGPVVRQGHGCRRLTGPAGRRLGHTPGSRYEPEVVRLAAGDLVLLHTRGFAATGTALTRGLRAIADATTGTTAAAPPPAYAAPGQLPLERLLAAVPHRVTDDACVLLAGAPSRASGVLLFSRAFDALDLDLARAEARACGAGNGLFGQVLFNFTLAVSEVLTNAVRHGGRSGHVRLLRSGTELVVEVTDAGRGIPAARRPSTGPQEGRVGGWGLWLARQICPAIVIDSGPDGTRVTMRFPLPG